MKKENPKFKKQLKRNRERKVMKIMGGFLSEKWEKHKEAVKEKVSKREELQKLNSKRRKEKTNGV